MKFRKHIFTLIFIIFMLTTFIIGVIKFNNWKESSRQDMLVEIEKCEKLNGNYVSDDQKNFCERLFTSKDDEDIAYFFAMVYVEDFIPLSSNLILILFVVISSCFYISKYLKNNILTNDLTREKYNRIKLKLFISSWIPALVIPCMLLIRLIVYYLMTKNFDYDVGASMWQIDTVSNIGLFFSAYLLIALFDSLIYANICLIVTRKKHNFILATILSCLIITGLELFLEIFGNLICTYIFKSGMGIVFNIINFGHFNDSYGLLIPTMVSLTIFAITLIVVNILYKDKEKLLMDCEAND